MSLKVTFSNVQGDSRHLKNIHDPHHVTTQTYETTFKNIKQGETYSSLIKRFSETSTTSLTNRWRIIRCGREMPWDTVLDATKDDWVTLLPRIGHWSTIDKDNQNPLVVINKAKWKTK